MSSVNWIWQIFCYVQFVYNNPREEEDEPKLRLFLLIHLAGHIVQDLDIRGLVPLDVGEVGADDVVAVDVVGHPGPVHQGSEQAATQGHFYVFTFQPVLRSWSCPEVGKSSSGSCTRSTTKLRMLIGFFYLWHLETHVVWFSKIPNTFKTAYHSR